MTMQQITDEIRAEIRRLEKALHILLGTEDQLREAGVNEQHRLENPNGDTTLTKRHFSEATREKMRRTMKKRWAAAKRAGLNTPAKVSVSGRARK